MKVGCFRPSFQTSFHRRSIPEPELGGRTPGSSKKDQGLGFLPDQSFSRSIFGNSSGNVARAAVPMRTASTSVALS